MDFCDSENLIYQAEDEGGEDCEVPGEHARLLLQEERTIQPHEEPMDTINLGIKENRKEVKVGTNLEPSIKKRLIQLLHDYVEVLLGHMKTCQNLMKILWYIVCLQERIVHQ